MEIIIKNLQKKIPVDPKRIRKAIRKAASFERKNISGEISVSFVNDAAIKRLNREFLHKNIPTDVLAFDYSESRSLNADIIVSTDTAIRNAKEFGTKPLYETYLYLIHGLLHLLGSNDSTPHEAKTMQLKLEAILRALRITQEA